MFRWNHRLVFFLTFCRTIFVKASLFERLHSCKMALATCLARSRSRVFCNISMHNDAVLVKSSKPWPFYNCSKKGYCLVLDGCDSESVQSAQRALSRGAFLKASACHQLLRSCSSGGELPNGVCQCGVVACAVVASCFCHVSACHSVVFCW